MADAVNHDACDASEARESVGNRKTWNQQAKRRSQRQGCNAEALCTPFSEWLPQVAACLEGELAPLFAEVGEKLDGHMKSLRPYLVHSHAQHEGHVKQFQTSFDPCHTDCPGFASFSTWEQPDSQSRPQSPRALVSTSLQLADISSFPKQALAHQSSRRLCQKSLIQADTPLAEVPQSHEASDVQSNAGLLPHAAPSDEIVPHAQTRAQLRLSQDRRWMADMSSKVSSGLLMSQPIQTQVSQSLGIGMQIQQMLGTEGDRGGGGGGDDHIKRAVKSFWWQRFCAFMILLDIFFEFFYVDAALKHELANHQAAKLDQNVSLPALIFASFFMLDIVLRVYAWRLAFFFGKHWKTNAFDSVVVVAIFIAEIVRLTRGRVFFPEWVAFVRTLRILRVVRVIMKWHRLLSLRTMFSSMLNCVEPMLWAFVFISLLLSLFSNLFMKVAVIWLREHAAAAESQPVVEALRTYFDGYLRTMISMFMAVTGGVDWQELYKPFAFIGRVPGLAFLSYVYFMYLGVFSVLVGICADRAFAANKLHQDFVAEEDAQQQRSFAEAVKDMFVAIDTQCKGTISQEQFLACQKNVRMTSFLTSHQLDMIEPSWLFSMLDTDESGSVTLAELTVGLLRLRGQARSADVLLAVTILMELRDELSRLVHGEKTSLAFDSQASSGLS